MKEQRLILLQPTQNPERWEVGWMSPQKSIPSFLSVENTEHLGLSGIMLFEYVLHFCI